jgi:hypothetical protein
LSKHILVLASKLNSSTARCYGKRRLVAPVTSRGLACISHQLSTVAAYLPASTALRSVVCSTYCKVRLRAFSRARLVATDISAPSRRYPVRNAGEPLAAAYRASSIQAAPGIGYDCLGFPGLPGTRPVPRARSRRGDISTQAVGRPTPASSGRAVYLRRWRPGHNERAAEATPIAISYQ